MKEYQKGDCTYYFESGIYAKVKILENFSDRDMLSYKVELIEIIRNPLPHIWKYRAGDSFMCDKVKNAPQFIIWELEDLEQ